MRLELEQKYLGEDRTVHQRRLLIEKVFPKTGQWLWGFKAPFGDDYLMAFADAPRNGNSDIECVGYLLSIFEDKPISTQTQTEIIIEISLDCDVLDYNVTSHERDWEGKWDSSPKERMIPGGELKSQERAMAYTTALLKSVVETGKCCPMTIETELEIHPILGR